MRLIAGLTALATLASCAATPPGCDGRALRALDADIAATERALATGRRFEPEQDGRTRLRLCAWPREAVLFCTERVQDARNARTVPIDPAAEEIRLADLRARRAALAPSCGG